MTGRCGFLVLSTFTAGCTVPKQGGLPEVARMLHDRGVPEVRWRQDERADAEVRARVRELAAGDLTLVTATQIALLNNARLQATYERLGIAQADVVQAGLLKNPSFSVGVHVPLDRDASASGPGVTGWDFNLLQDVLDLFLLPARKRLAAAEFERAKLEVADAVLELMHQVRSGFFAAQAASAIVELRRTIADAQAASAELAARQHEAGNLSELDLAREQALYTQTRLDLSRAETQNLTDREHLTALLGLWGPDTEWRMSVKLPEPSHDEPSLEHVEAYAIEHRLDLASARAEVAVLSHTLALVSRSRVIPGVSVGAHVDKDPEGITFAGPNLEIGLPIFDQGQAQVARLQAQVRQAQRLADARANEARAEVRSVRARLVGARQTVEYYRDTMVPMRERIVRLSQQHYNAMLLGTYQLLEAKRSEVDAYREYIEALRDYWIVRSELERASGGGLPMVEEQR
jgi:cobalt-zinc-cadmium efflux system outer membrane protein